MKKQTNLRLLLLIVITLTFMMCVGLIYSQGSTSKQLSNIQQTLNDMSADYILSIDDRLDSIYYNEIVSDTVIYNDYKHLHDSVIISKFNTVQLMYISWCEFARNFDLLDLDNSLEYYLNDKEFLHEKFILYTDYFASDILADNLQYWYEENGCLYNNY